MKRSVLAFASAILLSFAAANLSAEAASTQTATAESGESLVKKNAGNKTGNSSVAKERRPFTPEDLKKAQANKKKLEWWEMPKPPVFQSHSQRGGGHGGH